MISGLAGWNIRKGLRLATRGGGLMVMEAMKDERERMSIAHVAGKGEQYWVSRLSGSLQRFLFVY